MKKILPYLSLLLLLSCSSKKEEKKQDNIEEEVAHYNIHIDLPLEDLKKDLIHQGFKEKKGKLEKKEENLLVSIQLHGNTDINSYSISWEGDSEYINPFTKRFINALRQKYPDLQESNGYFATRYFEGKEEIILEVIISAKKVALSHRKNH